MAKVSVGPSNDFCPQTLFCYGTYKEDGTPNFGLFSWFSYYRDTKMGVMACVGSKKLTKDRIYANRVFSANLVTEELLPLADYFGGTRGYDGDKMNVDVEIEKGQVLDVPVLSKSPWVFELEVDRSFALDNGDVFLCRIRNVLADELLRDKSLSVEQRLKIIRPALTACCTYFNWDGSAAGAWGEPMKKIRKRETT